MRNFVYERIINEVAESLSLPKKIVDRAYRSYWRVVREHISQLPLKEDLSDEEFAQLQPNVNIPSIGKLYVIDTRSSRLKEAHKVVASLRLPFAVE